MKQFLFLVFVFFAFVTLSQNVTTVTGKVIEAETGIPVPFANVVFSGTTDGAITDFDGNFNAITSQAVDSIEVRYIGFLKSIKAVKQGTTQKINFQIYEDVQTLNEVVIYAGENPAWPIMRKVVDNKKSNDKRSLEAYQFEAYTKIEIDVDNISDDFRSRKAMRKISSVLDSIQQIAGEDGLPILPVFISEAISNFYYQNNPVMKHEEIIKTKVSGVGVTDGSVTSQIIGSTLQEYNFYQNWLNIVSKEFVSPIADGWKTFYDYDLVDSLMLGDEYCYRLDFYPKREEDLAFQGTMWIAKEDYGVKRIDATVNRSANLNFIEKIKIQQDLVRTDAGPWIPEKSRVIVDVSQVTEFSAGFLAKFYTSAKDLKVNKRQDPSLFVNPVSMREDVRVYDENYWQNKRHEQLSQTEINVFNMIDTMKQIPFVKYSTELVKFATTGYVKTGPVDLGPYTVFYGNTDIEGQRFGFGSRTNIDFSKKVTLGGYVAYGTRDERFKYRAYADFILNREKWSNLTFDHQKEIDQVWLLNDNVDQSSIFYTFSRFGNMTDPFLYEKNRISLFKQLTRGLSYRLELKNQRYEPQFDFSFTPDRDNPSETFTNMNISEVTLETRFARDEIFIINDNQRVSLGTVNWPAITFSYSYGIPDLLGSNLEYHRLKLKIEKKQKLGPIGVGYFNLNGGYIFGKVPYPLLFNTIGNETFVYVNFAYNMMNFFEFSSDKYLAFNYRHSFEGFVLNRIPLIRKLKLRLVGILNIVYGSMGNTNLNLVNYPTNENGDAEYPFFTLENKPYIEVGYGVENIFKFFRVNFFHRLNYLDHPDVNKFGIKINFQFIL